MNTKMLLIDSRDRLSYSNSSSDFTIELPEAITNIERVRLVAANVPNTIYNVRSTNNIIRWTRGSAFTYTIPEGAYTVTNLLSTIQTGMNAADANSYTLTYSSTTYKVTIAGSAAFVLNWSGSSTPYYMLGFSSSDSSSGTSHTGTNVANMMLPYNLLVEIPQLGPLTITSRNNGRCTFTVPIDVNSGNMVNFTEGNYEQKLNTGNLTLYKLDVRLLHYDRTAVNLNGADWNLLLSLDICH